MRTLDTGYTVGRLSARDHAELLTVVGNLASVNPGESLLLQGEWVDNARYGRQFQIEKYETILPANVVGLRKYLGSGLIKGIGPKMAALIVRKFGMDTMDVIEHEPDKLARVPGIGRKRVEIIKEAWEAQREIKKRHALPAITRCKHSTRRKDLQNLRKRRNPDRHRKPVSARR